MLLRPRLNHNHFRIGSIIHGRINDKELEYTNTITEIKDNKVTFDDGLFEYKDTLTKLIKENDAIVIEY